MLPQWVSALSYILVMISLGLTSSCPAGERRVGSGCVPCEEGKYRGNDVSYSHCMECDFCREGTEELSPCTKISNIQCKCLEGFTRRHRTICDCVPGYGIDSTGKKCIKCENGFFSAETDAESKCQKWKDCGQLGLGVKVKGNATTDVICNTATSSPNLPMKTSTPDGIVSTATTVILPQVNSTSRVPTLALITKSTTTPPSHYYNGMVALLITAFILLTLCFALIFKLAAGLCLKRLKKPLIRAETVCRTPVEECGDKSCSSLVSSTDSSQIIEDV